MCIETQQALFRLLPDGERRTVTIGFEGQALQVPAGISVAAALLTQGVRVFRKTPLSGAARAPLCMMGVCFECLLCIDGEPNQQGCVTTVRDGMQIEVQEGAAHLGDSQQWQGEGEGAHGGV